MLSHVSLVSGFGNSCNHPLFAKRPSQMVGSGRKIISSPGVAAGCPVSGCAAKSPLSETVFAADAEPAITPSRRVFSQKLSKRSVPVVALPTPAGRAFTCTEFAEEPFADCAFTAEAFDREAFGTEAFDAAAFEGEAFDAAAFTARTFVPSVLPP